MFSGVMQRVMTRTFSDQKLFKFLLTKCGPDGDLHGVSFALEHKMAYLVVR